MIELTLANAGECLKLQTPVEYLKQLAVASLTLQKVRGKKGSGEGAISELDELRGLMEPKGA